MVLPFQPRLLAPIRQSFFHQLPTARAFHNSLFLRREPVTKPFVDLIGTYDIPPYPHGPAKLYKQSNKGLYGGARIQFGNYVSPKWNVKSRRIWRPNLQYKRLWSPSLQRWVRVRLTTRVLRTIDKCGGLDEYLLGDGPRRIKDLGVWGWALRWRIMQTPSIRERFRKQREEMGLPELEEVEFEDIIEGGKTAKFIDHELTQAEERAKRTGEWDEAEEVVGEKDGKQQRMGPRFMEEDAVAEQPRPQA
ncbi:hypothetical protein BDY21DRAFT_335492 [Lineolata rhizophorae]|uniref:Large ribosomal subunit protein bL28m n=1 Tax=Lineolata rhizophorae TaxID=578093 RepID=A0A6A6P9J0_9PEZI|nr:hypothetical protein BDY21DRAFT_335492 [Lineolata rhizophorae]